MHFPNGIDVSDNNGDFDWHSWNGHIDFAMIKASEGPTEGYPDGLRDTQFDRNWAGAKAIGVHRFAYHFFHPDENPAAQAAWFVDTVKAAGLDLSDNFVIDFEVENSGMSVLENAFAAWVFCREVNRLAPQHRLLCYTYPYFAETGYCAMLGFLPLWIANYDVSKPYVPIPWTTWQFWQYVGVGTDLDRFNGSEHDLEVFCTR
jgi:lysozyme